MARKLKRIKLRRTKRPYGFAKFLLTISIIAIIITAVLSGIFPFKYIAALAGASVILLIIFYLLLKSEPNVRKGWKSVCSFIAILISAVLLISSYLITDILNNAMNIFAAGKTVENISIVTLSNADINGIKDLQDTNVGIYALPSLSQGNELCISELQDKTKNSVTIKEYDNESNYINALMNNEISAIILNENQRSSVESEYPSFAQNTKVIYTASRHEKTATSSNPADNIATDPFIVFISGVDTLGLDDEVTHSDVNMLAVINPLNKKVLLIGIPRDFYVDINESEGEKDKLTHTGLYGIDCTIDSVEQLLDIKINYYARVSYNSLIDLVDTLGGITIYSEYAFSNPITGVSVKSGSNTLNGAETLAFCRERYALPHGDKDRVQNQMQVVKSLLNKIISIDTLFNCQDIITCIAEGIETNLSAKEMKGLIRMQLSDMKSWDISIISLDGYDEYAYTYSGGDQELYVMVPYEDSINNAQEEINNIMNMN